MQSLRRISRPIGQLTNTFCRPSRSVTAPGIGSTTRQVALIRLQTRAFRSSSCHQADSEPQEDSLELGLDSQHRYFDTPEDIDHKIPNLPKPWRLSDLTGVEQSAYAKYGPGFAQYLPAEQLEQYQEERAKNKRIWEKKYGEKWHSLVHEARKLRFNTEVADSPAVIALRYKRFKVRARYRALCDQGVVVTGDTPESAELRELKETAKALRKEQNVQSRKNSKIPRPLDYWVKLVSKSQAEKKVKKKVQEKAEGKAEEKVEEKIEEKAKE